MPNNILGDILGDTLSDSPVNIFGDTLEGTLGDILGLDQDGLSEAIKNEGLPSFRAKQIWRWVWRHGITEFADMTDLSKPVREKLSEKFTVSRPRISERQISKDGTIKWLVRFKDGNEAETVYIPDKARGTLCISSQVGCTLTCSFCHTGTQKLVRNLTVQEITGQVMLAMDELGEWPASKIGRKITNIVLMGMGEPLFNYENVRKAMAITMGGEGIGISKRRITLSTSGLVPEIEKTGLDLGVNLAISLHAVNDELRNQLVPINRKYPLESLIDACRNYPGLNNARRITWEYVMLKDINDSNEDALKLIKLIKGIPSKINLIPFNPWPGSQFTCSTPERIEEFAKIVMRAGYASPVRTPRGQDIFAACGQLKSQSTRNPKQSTRIA